MRTRQRRIQIRMNDHELAKVDHAAKKLGLNRSEYFRHLINDRIPEDRPTKDYLGTLIGLREIGTHITQIARVANTTGVIDKSRFDDLYREIIKLIMDLIDEAEMPREAGK